MRKSQVTLFIIVGIIIVVGVGLLVFLMERDDTSTNFESIHETKSQTTLYLEACTENLLTEAISHNGMQGGYFVPLNDTFTEIYQGYLVPVYLSKSDIPSIETIEAHLKYYIKNRLIECIGKNEIYKEPKVEVKINKGITTMDVVVPVEIISNTTAIYDEKRFKESVEIDYYALDSAIHEIFSALYKNSTLIPISMLNDIALRYGFQYGIREFENHMLMYLSFNDTLSKDIDYVYLFLYDMDDIEDSLEEAKTVEIEQFIKKDAYIGYLFEYDVSDDLPGENYTDSSDFFDIGPTGNIRFTPQENDYGSYIIDITATLAEETKHLTLSLDIKKENYPPEIKDIPMTEFDVGKNYTFMLEASDPENGTLLYSINTSLENIYIHPATGEITFSPTKNQTGIHLVAFFVGDIYGNIEEYKTVFMVIGNE
ncbi:hypothetical protein JXB31_04985 [Candidatus Woesearchaeota archaeon]|nr:hypothetical protein [Candidatus Woesearchaeota archaeon]